MVGFYNVARGAACIAMCWLASSGIGFIAVADDSNGGVSTPGLVVPTEVNPVPSTTPASPATREASEQKQESSADKSAVDVADNNRTQTVMDLIKAEAAKSQTDNNEKVKIERVKTSANVNLNQTKAPSSNGFTISASDANSQQTERFDDIANKAYEAAQVGHLEAALVLYQKALALDPKSNSIRYAMATIYHKRGQYDKAEQLYRHVLQQNPADHKALINYLSLLATTDSSKALKELLELEQINNNFAPVIGQIGIVYAQQKRYDQAISYLQRAVALDPGELFYLYNLAVTYDKKGEGKRARQIYYQVVEYSQFHNVKLPVSLDKLEARIRELT